MAEIQNKLLGAAGAVAGAAISAKKTVGKKKSVAEKAMSKQDQSAIAAEKAKASLQEHREAKKRSRIKAGRGAQKEQASMK